MTDRIVIIRPDGSVEEIKATAPPSLSALQEMCGGYVQQVPLFDKYEGEKCKVYCDEEGIVKRQEYNDAATQAWFENEEPEGSWLPSSNLVGNVVILQGAAMRGW